MADYQPRLYETHIAHYFGDTVRQLFFATAALLLVAAPWYADHLRDELPFEVFGALALVALAGLTNPHNKRIMYVNATAAGIGLLVYETWALNSYAESTWLQFFLRQAIALLFLAAFYFSMKSVRAFLMHQVGKQESVDEFDEERVSEAGSHPTSNGNNSFRDDFNPWTTRSNNARKNGNKKLRAEEGGSRMSPGRSIEEVMPKSHPYEEHL